jgi:methylenetetrahydrofolate reductase (NADPH)
MERMVATEPLFIDVTWGAGGTTSDLTLSISAAAQKYLGVEVLMHLTCTNLKVEDVKDALNKVYRYKIHMYYVCV